MAPHLRWSVCLSQHNPRWRGIVKQMSFTRAFYGPISRFTNRHNFKIQMRSFRMFRMRNLSSETSGKR
jgi:hypothetical protein